MHLPVLPHSYVARRRLWTCLDTAARGSATMVIGTVGSGKTMGVAGWLHNSGMAVRAVWLAADDSLGFEQLEPLFDRTDPTTGEPALVVIDDAHRLRSSTLNGIDQRVRERPESIRTVLISLTELGGDWLQATMAGNVTVLNGDLLRLDDEESAALTASHAHTRSKEVAAAVAQRADGWCAAVVLMARALGSSPDPVAAAERLGMLGPDHADRVADEAFAAMTERQRHVLLCVATEPFVTAELAARLTNDSRAGELLARLSANGLLVTSVNTRPEHRILYTVHPLLVEVIRRQIAAGGVDARRAGSTVRRAVELDLAEGSSEHALRRLLATHSTDEARELIASDGRALLLRGHGDEIVDFARTESDAVEHDPRLWMPVLYVHWLSDDMPAATAMLDRIVSMPRRLPDVDTATARLMRGRLGLESLTGAIQNARRVTDGLENLPARLSITDLRYELGLALCWEGELEDAIRQLNLVRETATALHLPMLATSALSHVGVALFLDGRYTAALACAAEVLAVPDHPSGHTVSFVRDRAQAIAELVSVVDLPASVPRAHRVPGELHAHSSDHAMETLVRLRRARLHLVEGHLVAARLTLEAPGRPVAPNIFRVTLALELGALATLARDRGGMKVAHEQLLEAGNPGAAGIVAGWLADLDGDRRRAAAAWQASAVASSAMPIQAMAFAFSAQVCADLGERAHALAQLREALALTEPARFALPFFGWVRHGRPMPSLLAEAATASPRGWAAELVGVLATREGILAQYRTAQDAEPDVTMPASPAPVLTPRERVVLDELSRGATYADIAEHLFLSENTVKTHITSLYGKLSAKRRSEALETARRLHML